ncbi:hypothetical protein Hanom_Chr14g01260971 [Helianthus anomalus]
MSRTGTTPEEPTSHGNIPIAHGFHDFATLHLSLVSTAAAAFPVDASNRICV